MRESVHISVGGWVGERERECTYKRGWVGGNMNVCEREISYKCGWVGGDMNVCV